MNIIQYLGCDRYNSYYTIKFFFKHAHASSNNRRNTHTQLAQGADRYAFNACTANMCEDLARSIVDQASASPANAVASCFWALLTFFCAIFALSSQRWCAAVASSTSSLRRATSAASIAIATGIIARDNNKRGRASMVGAKVATDIFDLSMQRRIPLILRHLCKRISTAYLEVGWASSYGRCTSCDNVATHRLG